MNNNETKMVIIIRKDLNMRKGKFISQAMHGVMGLMFGYMDEESSSETTIIKKFQYLKNSAMGKWLNSGYKKVTLYVNSEKELLEIKNNADRVYIPNHLVSDYGRTEFHGIKTKTCLVLGPDYSDELDQITGHLKLL
jgi:PTH2 family peptidyl-tRNA hydrolase